MVMCALKPRKQIAQRMLQFLFRIGANDERLVHRLAKPLDRIRGPGAQDFRVRFHSQELWERYILFLKPEPTDSLPQMAVLDFIFGMSGEFDRRRPASFDAKLGQESPSARFQHAPQLTDESKRTQVEDDVVR